MTAPVRTVVVYDGTPGERVVTRELVIVGTTPQNLLPTVRQYVQGGAEQIELCGGFALDAIAAVADAVGAYVSVFANRYAYDAVDAVAAFRQDERQGQARLFACLFMVSAGQAMRVDHEDGAFIGVESIDSVPAVVAGLPPQSFGLIEVYTGLGARAAAAAAAVSGGVPVGFTEVRSGAR